MNKKCKITLTTHELYSLNWLLSHSIDGLCGDVRIDHGFNLIKDFGKQVLPHISTIYGKTCNIIRNKKVRRGK